MQAWQAESRAHSGGLRPKPYCKVECSRGAGTPDSDVTISTLTRLRLSARPRCTR